MDVWNNSIIDMHTFQFANLSWIITHARMVSFTSCFYFTFHANDHCRLVKLMSFSSILCLSTVKPTNHIIFTLILCYDVTFRYGMICDGNFCKNWVIFRRKYLSPHTNTPTPSQSTPDQAICTHEVTVNY